MYEASGTLYSSTAATAQYNSQPAQSQDYSTATVIYQPPIIQPFIQPQQYYVQQQMWSASFQQAPATYYPQYTIQQPTFQTTPSTPEQTQTVPLVNLARLVNSSSSQGYSTTGVGGEAINMSSTSTTITHTQGATSTTRNKMVPTRLKNMGGGARTKAKMREMLEQQKQMELAKAKKQATTLTKRKRDVKPKEKSTTDVKPEPKSNADNKEKETGLNRSIDDTIESVLSAASASNIIQTVAQPQQLHQTPGSVQIGITQAQAPRKKGRPRKYPLPDSDSSTTASPAKLKPMNPAAFTQTTTVCLGKVTPEKPKAIERPKSPKKVVEPHAKVSESSESEPVVKKPRGRPRTKSLETNISSSQPKVQIAHPTIGGLEVAPAPKVSSPRKLSPDKILKSPSSEKAAPPMEPEFSSSKIGKSKLTPKASAMLKGLVSKKLKKAKVRVRASAKTPKVDESCPGIVSTPAHSNEVASTSSTATVFQQQQASIKTKTPAARIRIRKPKRAGEILKKTDVQSGESDHSPPRRSSKLAKAKPTDESMTETIDYVLGILKQETSALAPAHRESPSVAFPSTSAFARLALTGHSKPVVIKKSNVPTVRVKKSDLRVVKRLSEKERREHAQKGPSLKVKREKVTFYRGGEEEEEAVVRFVTERPRFDFDESVPWRCTFCKFRPYSFGLGDLFGPYFVDRLVDGEVRQKETWLHSGCGIWAPGVVLVGCTLYGLTDAVEQCERVSCTICKKGGATIACLERGCQEVVHLPCAVLNKWSLNEKNFKSLCGVHGERAAYASAVVPAVVNNPLTRIVKVEGC